MKKKTVLFANEQIVIAHIVSLTAYERDHVCHVVVKTATREFIEKFSDENCSRDLRRRISTNFLFGGSDSNLKNELEEFELAKKKLIEKTKKRYDEIMNLL